MGAKVGYFYRYGNISTPKSNYDEYLETLYTPLPRCHTVATGCWPMGTNPPGFQNGQCFPIAGRRTRDCTVKNVVLP